MKILMNFVIFEGCDGSGTTTQIGILEDFSGRTLPGFPCSCFIQHLSRQMVA